MAGSRTGRVEQYGLHFLERGDKERGFDRDRGVKEGQEERPIVARQAYIGEKRERHIRWQGTRVEPEQTETRVVICGQGFRFRSAVHALRQDHNRHGW